jgi:hypothetical protein
VYDQKLGLVSVCVFLDSLRQCLEKEERETEEGGETRKVKEKGGDRL